MDMHYHGPTYDIRRPLLGVTGRKGHGKDTVAQILRTRFLWTPVAFADELKRIAKNLWDLSEEQVNGTLADKERVDPRWGVAPRHLLQTLGTEAGRNAHPETWIRYLLRTLETWERQDWEQGIADLRTGFVVSDVRFPNEASAVRRHGGTVWRVERPGYGSGSYEAHASETSIDLVVPDRILVNDGSIADLEAKIEAALSCTRETTLLDAG
jgi:hypothetical protein